MTEWKKLSDARLVKQLGDVTIIVPVERPTPVPLFCPVCSLMMRTDEDSAYFREVQCCSKCGMKWADPDRKRWQSGWRPDVYVVSDEVELRCRLPLGVKLDGVGI